LSFVVVMAAQQGRRRGALSAAQHNDLLRMCTSCSTHRGHRGPEPGEFMTLHGCSNNTTTYT